MTFGSLFTGIGGLDLGLERAGMVCRWQVEINPYCREVLNKTWPEVHKHEDITKISGHELERVDLVCGGFPCQDLSQAGKRIGIEGTRSGLWFEYARLLGIIRPRYVLIENVPGILVPGAMSRVVGELARLGYVGCWRSLRAAEFGASHLRKRIFIVADLAYSGGEGLPDSERSAILGTERRDEGRTASELHRAPVADSDGIGRGQRGESTEPTPGFELFDGCDLPTFAPGPSDTRWPLILQDFPTLAPALEPSVCRVADGLPNPLDAALSNRTKRLRALGNAVVPQIAQWIGERILEHDAQS